jgi:hypothetical protein
MVQAQRHLLRAGGSADGKGHKASEQIAGDGHESLPRKTHRSFASTPVAVQGQ